MGYILLIGSPQIQISMCLSDDGFGSQGMEIHAQGTNDDYCDNADRIFWSKLRWQYDKKLSLGEWSHCRPCVVTRAMLPLVQECLGSIDGRRQRQGEAKMAIGIRYIPRGQPSLLVPMQYVTASIR